MNYKKKCLSPWQPQRSLAGSRYNTFSENIVWVHISHISVFDYSKRSHSLNIGAYI